MEPVRYRPGEAIRWLALGADSNRKLAKEKGLAIVRQRAPRSAKDLGNSVLSVTGALMQFGHGAYADVMQKKAHAHEYFLEDDGFVVRQGGSSKTISYASVKRINLERERASVQLADGELTIKPYAYIHAGRLKVPIGWERNGMEVPFELLIEELAARCGIEVEES